MEVRRQKEIRNAEDLITSYMDFFKERGHKEIASASLYPENDPSVLFTTAGMHPLIPYLQGEKHPLGSCLTGCQKCLRTGDIDEVGDPSHHTFFEMLGNWSLGDYFKKKSIMMSFEFLTKVLNIPLENIAVTVYEGDETVPRDEEAYQVWRRMGLSKNQIFFYGKDQNWWGPAGLTGPCGPDTEIFYDNGQETCSETCGPSCGCGKYVEIWNNVFMEYYKNEDGTLIRLDQKNVDTGMGLERILPIILGKRNAYETVLFQPVINRLEQITGKAYEGISIRPFRIIADHIRAITFLLGDPRAVTPSNSEQGYILRRLIRRSLRILHELKVSEDILTELADIIIGDYKFRYPELEKNRRFILEQLEKEVKLFHKTLVSGLKIAEKYIGELSHKGILSGEFAFKLYDTYGFPIEFTVELAAEHGFTVDMEGFDRKYLEHQEKSRVGSDAKFKGGLADHSEQTTRLHTATHLLGGALRKVLGENIFQRGSNINSERLRFDFSLDRKLTKEELMEVTRLVNEAINKQISVECEEMTVEEAKSRGAIGIFEEKYSDLVKVYIIDGYSMEICGGPHAGNTKELGSFRIIKEESSAAGVRRIKAVIDQI